MNGTKGVVADRTAWPLGPFLLFLAVLSGLIALDMADGSSIVADIDDQMRYLQLRHLVDSGAWFDMRLPMITMPDVYVSPWSRLVDLPYVLLAWLFGLFVAPADALKFATLAWPPILFLPFAAISFQAMRRLNGGREMQPIGLMAAVIAMALAASEFAPGRIDHHNVQLVLMVTMLWGLAAWSSAGAVAVGLSATLSVVVGLECLPFVVIAFGGMVVAYGLGGPGAAGFLRRASASMFVTTIFSSLAFAGPTGMASVQCDAFSAPYISAMAGFSAVLWGAVRFLPERTRPLPRFLLLGVLGLMGCAALALAFPLCLSGPYQMIDPVSRALWLDRVVQEHDILYFRQQGRIGLIMLIVLSALGLVGWRSLPLAREVGGNWPGYLVAWLVALSSLVLTVALIRYIRFPASLMALFIPAVVDSLVSGRTTRTAGQRLAWLVPGVLAALAPILIFLIVPQEATRMDAVHLMSADDCRDEDFSVLQGLAPGIVMAPIGLSLNLIERAPAGISVAAVPFHRASPGIRRSLLAFTTQDPDVRRSALEPFDYVAICRFPLDPAQETAPLFAALASGGSWPGLVPVAGPTETRLQLFSIDHAALN